MQPSEPVATWIGPAGTTRQQFSTPCPRAPASSGRIFGPVAPIVRFTDLDAAIRAANDTEYGLVSYVYTRDLATGMSRRTSIRHGQAQPRGGVGPAAPFGRVKPWTGPRGRARRPTRIHRRQIHRHRLVAPTQTQEIRVATKFVPSPRFDEYARCSRTSGMERRDDGVLLVEHTRARYSSVAPSVARPDAEDGRCHPKRSAHPHRLRRRLRGRLGPAASPSKKQTCRVGPTSTPVRMADQRRSW